MKTRSQTLTIRPPDYDALLDRVAALVDEARRVSARTVNALMTATYWSIGRHIVEFEQAGKSRAKYGEEVVGQLAADLTTRFGRGFTRINLFNLRAFYLANVEFIQTVSGQLRLPNKILATEYRTVLPDEKLIAEEIEKTR